MGKLVVCVVAVILGVIIITAIVRALFRELRKGLEYHRFLRSLGLRWTGRTRSTLGATASTLVFVCGRTSLFRGISDESLVGMPNRSSEGITTYFALPGGEKVPFVRLENPPDPLVSLLLVVRPNRQGKVDFGDDPVMWRTLHPNHRGHMPVRIVSWTEGDRTLTLWSLPAGSSIHFHFGSLGQLNVLSTLQGAVAIN